MSCRRCTVCCDASRSSGTWSVRKCNSTELFRSAEALVRSSVCVSVVRTNPMVELSEAEALNGPNPPDALAEIECRVSTPVCACSAAAEVASIWKRIDAWMRPESITMRCIPICTIVASICCRFRASDRFTNPTSSCVPVGTSASASSPSAARMASAVGGVPRNVSLIGSGSSSGSGLSRGSGGSGTSILKLDGNWSASHRLAGSSLLPPSDAKPSSDCETARTRSRYC